MQHVPIFSLRRRERIVYAARDSLTAEEKVDTMKTRSHKLALLGALLLPLFVASCGGGGGAATEDDSPEANAFRFRDGVMHAVSWKMTRIGGMASGEIPANNEQFTKDARDLAALAGMLTDGFIPNSIVKGSIALPEIWTNWSDFKRRPALQDGARGHTGRARRRRGAGMVRRCARRAAGATDVPAPRPVSSPRWSGGSVPSERRSRGSH
jgi:cytochrome c556